MMIPLLISIHSNRAHHGIAMERMYEFYAITRQGFFKAKKLLESEIKMMRSISEDVRKYRLTKDRRAGSRFLFYNLNIKDTYNIGVTKFERLMRQYGLTLIQLRIKVITTQSCLQSWNYKNLCNGLIINSINQLVVGDLTYIIIGKMRYYLFCLTDVFSAKIVGYHVSDRMRKQEALKAFDMWVRLRKKKNVEGCIHHTDGGSQYFSNGYMKEMKDKKLQVSVAKSCLENGYAEQKNGVLKNHLIPTIKASSKIGIEKELKQSIQYYNAERKQQNLGWRSPNTFELYIASSEEQCQILLHDHEQNLSSQRLGFSRHKTAKKKK